MCLYKPWKSKTLAFFDDKRSKSGPRNFFKDFGCIILFKTLTGLIRAINRTNSWLNQTCRGDKRCQWRKEDHDSSRDPPKKKTHNCWPKLLPSERFHCKLQKIFLPFLNPTHTFFNIFVFVLGVRTYPFRKFNVQIIKSKRKV